MMLQNVSHARTSSLIRRSALYVMLTAMMVGPGWMSAQTSDTPAATPSQNTQDAGQIPAVKTVPAAKSRKDKNTYNGPNTIVVLPPTPMLDAEGKQRVDPDGKPMFNPAVQQLRDKKGHPEFDADGKPVFQTPGNLGYDEHGKKIKEKKEKEPKATPMSIVAGTLTVDGWTGKARLNYDIADLKYLYIYAPGIGVTIVSQNTFPGAKEQPGAFNGKSLHVTVEGHTMEVASDKLLLGKKAQSAWVVVDRNFMLPSKFPVFGFGSATRAPYAWPGSKVATEAGAAEAPPLPVDVRPTLQLAPCPAGTMRPPGPPVLPGQAAQEQPCVPISSAAPAAAGTPAPASTPATSGNPTQPH